MEKADPLIKDEHFIFSVKAEIVKLDEFKN